MHGNTTKDPEASYLYDIQFVFVTFSANPSNTSCATAASRSGLDIIPRTSHSKNTAALVVVGS